MRGSGALYLLILSRDINYKHEAIVNGTGAFSLPTDYPETKLKQEAQIMALMESSSADLLVLARYMQILSNDLVSKSMDALLISITRSYQVLKACLIIRPANAALS